MSAPIVARAAIEIQAPIAVIWAILLNVTAYLEWNPFIVEVTNVTPPGPSIAVGTQFTLHVEYSDGSTSTSRETVTEVTPPAAEGGNVAVFAYRYSDLIAALGVVQGTDAAGAGATRYRTEEVFRGPGAVLVPRAQVEDGFERMAMALKARAESSLP